MKEISRYLFVAKLICKERVVGLDDSERDQLDTWRGESDKRERIFSSLQNINVDELENRYEGIDVDRKWNNFKDLQSRKKRRVRMSVSVAASVCLLITGALWLWIKPSEDERVVLAEQGKQNNVSLVLANGETVDISNPQKGKVKLDQGAKLYEGKRLEYTRADFLREREL